MILIITHRDDYTADFVIHQLNKKKIPYYRFNCEDTDKIPYSLSADNDFLLKLYTELDFTSVWFRRTKLPTLPSTLSISEKLYLLRDYERLLNNIFSCLESLKWLSKPEFIYKAENKLLQLKHAKKLEFEIPDTIITNDKSNIKSFAAKHQGNVIVKSLGSNKLARGSSTSLMYTSRVTPFHIEQIEAYDITPCIFQNYIDKDYEIRVTVINDKVFSAKVNSQTDELSKIDWRKKKLLFEECQLPYDIEQKCIALVKSLNLSFGAIDLIRTPNSKYYFLEINPNGQWAWIEKDTALPISQSIIEFLTSTSV